MDYIRDTLASLELTITHPTTESSENMIIIGNHKGFAALSAVARLFKLNETSLSRYKIPEFDWTSFIIKIGYIISDAQSISRQNQSSSRNKSEKEEIYGALIMQLATIDVVFDIIDDFNKKYPQSDMLDRYQIEKVLRLRLASRKISLNSKQ